MPHPNDNGVQPPSPPPGGRFGRIAPHVYDELSKLGRDELRVLVALGRYADGNWLARPSLRTLEKATGLKNGHVARSLKKLTSRGIVRRFVPGSCTRATVYDLSAKANTCDEAPSDQSAQRVPPSAEAPPHMEAAPTMAEAASTGGRRVPPGLGAFTSAGGHKVPPPVEYQQIKNIDEQRSNSAAAAAAPEKFGDGDDRRLQMARAEVQRRIAAGQKVCNAEGLARVLARDGFEPAPDVSTVGAVVKAACVKRLDELRRKYGLPADFHPARAGTCRAVDSKTIRAIRDDLASLAARIRAEYQN